MEIRKKIIVLLILTISINLYSQNWNLINKDYQYHFKKNNIYNTTILVDSIDLLGSDTIFFLNRVIKKCDTCINTIQENYLIYDSPNFLNKTILKQGNNYTFLNPTTFTIKTNFPINTLWDFDILNNITAKVISEDYETIYNTYDSTKIIMLSTNEFIKISKNHGILSFKDDYTQNGLKTPMISKGFSLPGFYNFYNFDIGDVFQYREEKSLFGSGNGNGYLKHYKITILEKHIFQDSIKYKIFQNTMIESTAGPAGPQEPISPVLYLTDTTYLTFRNEDELINIYNKKIIPEPSIYSSQNSIVYVPTYVQIDSLGLVSYNVGFSDNIYDMVPYYKPHSQGLLRNTLAHNHKRSIGVGIGLKYEISDYFESSFSKELTGYIKNGIEYGIINSNSFYLGINKNISKYDIELYPNPANNFLYINFKKRIDFTQIKIINISGSILFKHDPINKKLLKINIADLKKGVYFLSIVNNNRTLKKRFVVK